MEVEVLRPRTRTRFFLAYVENFNAFPQSFRERSSFKIFPRRVLVCRRETFFYFARRFQNRLFAFSICAQIPTTIRFRIWIYITNKLSKHTNQKNNTPTHLDLNSGSIRIRISRKFRIRANSIKVIGEHSNISAVQLRRSNPLNVRQIDNASVKCPN